MEKVLVVIPSYNAAATLSVLIERIRRAAGLIEILVVDDGSRDDTAEIAKKSNAQLIRHELNRGKGEALRSGFDYAIQHEFDAVITMDSDLQHLPEEIPRFIESYCDNDTILVGTRQIEGSMPFARRVSNTMTTFVASLFGTSRIVDSQSGFRLIPVQILKDVKLTSSRFDLEPELLIKASRRGYKIRPVPISTVYRPGKSWINPPADTIRFLILLVKSLFW